MLCCSGQLRSSSVSTQFSFDSSGATTVLEANTELIRNGLVDMKTEQFKIVTDQEEANIRSKNFLSDAQNYFMYYSTYSLEFSYFFFIVMSFINISLLRKIYFIFV